MCVTLKKRACACVCTNNNNGNHIMIQFIHARQERRNDEEDEI